MSNKVLDQFNSVIQNSERAFNNALQKSEYEDFTDFCVIQSSVDLCEDLMSTEGILNAQEIERIAEIREINDDTLYSMNQFDTAWIEDIEDDLSSPVEDRVFDSDVVSYPYSRKEVEEANTDLLSLLEGIQ